MKIPEKPKKPEEQLSVLWDFVCNDLAHKINMLSLKVNFILVFSALVLALVGVVITLVIKGLL